MKKDVKTKKEIDVPRVFDFPRIQGATTLALRSSASKMTHPELMTLLNVATASLGFFGFLFLGGIRLEAIGSRLEAIAIRNLAHDCTIPKQLCSTLLAI